MVNPDPREPAEESSTGLPIQVAAALCYVLFAVTGAVFLVIERRSTFVRFHAMQATLVGIALYVAMQGARFVPVGAGLIGFLLALCGAALWIFLVVQALRGERFELPFLGGLALRRTIDPGPEDDASPDDD